MDNRSPCKYTQGKTWCNTKTDSDGFGFERNITEQCGETAGSFFDNRTSFCTMPQRKIDPKVYTLVASQL